MHSIPFAGLSSLESTIINDWLGPIFLVAVAAFAIIFIKDRAWMKLIAFVGIAAIVGLLIFGGSALFGSSTSNCVGLCNVANTAANKVQ